MAWVGCLKYCESTQDLLSNSFFPSHEFLSFFLLLARSRWEAVDRQWLSRFL